MEARLAVELWTSWASMLRSYAAVAGLHGTHHAVIEVGAEEIVLRVDTRWLRFTHTQEHSSAGHQQSFALNEDGTVMLGGKIDEMDLTAERVTREMMQ
jgi:hypothetical protein